MIYAIFNPVPWGLFLLGVALCIASVKAFHRKYPYYPFGRVAGDIKAKEIMNPIPSLNTGEHPRLRVREQTSVSIVQEFLGHGATSVGVENTEGKLVGIISMKQIPPATEQFKREREVQVAEVLGR